MKIDIDEDFAVNPKRVFAVRLAVDPINFPGYALGLKSNWLKIELFGKLKFDSDLMTTPEAIRIKAEIESHPDFRGATI